MKILTSCLATIFTPVALLFGTVIHAASPVIAIHEHAPMRDDAFWKAGDLAHLNTAPCDAEGNPTS